MKEKEEQTERHKRKGISIPSFNMNMKIVFLHQVGDSISSLFVLTTALLFYFFPDQHWIVYIDPVVR
jgi:Co/Zn/Cd efflux system component